MEPSNALFFKPDQKFEVYGEEKLSSDPGSDHPQSLYEEDMKIFSKIKNTGKTIRELFNNF